MEKMRKENPFPADGDASKIPRFTDFLICLREDRKNHFSNVIIPLLDRANSGEVHGNHDAVIVGEIGRGKTHLLKYLDKKLAGKKVRLVSDSLEIPNYNNILPVYVKFDAGMIVKPEFFVYFFLNYLFGYGVEKFGVLSSPLLEKRRSELQDIIEDHYTQRIGQDIKKPITIATQHALSLIYNVSAEALRLTGKKCILFLFDELEGIVLTADKQRKESLMLVMDFMRQFHDSINLEEISPAPLYSLYAMTAPAYDTAAQARRESGAWLSRLRSQLIQIPQFSEEELMSLVSCALDNDDLSVTAPFHRDALTYIYRSVMGMPRYAIEALHNSYNLYSEQGLSEISVEDVVRSTHWLNPDTIIDKSKIAKLEAELGPRYGYLVQILSNLIGHSSISLENLTKMSQKIARGKDVTRERVVNDINKFLELGYVETSGNNEIIKVSSAFYHRILVELDRETTVKVIVEPARFIAAACDTATREVKSGKILDQERTRRLQEALDRVLKQLFSEEGVLYETVSGDWRLYKTRRSSHGDPILFLSKILVNSSVTHAKVVDLFEKTRANAFLILYDLDDDREEEKVIYRLKKMNLPEPYPWVQTLFKDSFVETPDSWTSKAFAEEVSAQMNLDDIGLFQPIGLGRKSFTPSGGIADRVVIDIRGLWYSITEIGRTLEPEHAQLVDSTLKYVIQDIFGLIRNQLSEKSLVLAKKTRPLLRFNKRLVTFTKTLMRDKKCREAVSTQQIILSNDLPSGVNAQNMRNLCKTGLFTETSPTSWRPNSLNDAQKFNPWIRFIVFNSLKGDLQNQAVKAIKRANLGSHEESVLQCLSFHFELLESLDLIQKGAIVLVDNRTRLLQALGKLRERINHLKTREFKGSENILDKYIRKANQVEADSKKAKTIARTDLEADTMYSANTQQIEEISTSLEELIEQQRDVAKEKKEQMEGRIDQVKELQERAISICDSLDFNRVDSVLVKALMKKPVIKHCILEMDLSLTKPQRYDKIIMEKRRLDKDLNDGLLMKFISDYDSFELHVNDAIEESREVGENVRKEVTAYLRALNKSYESLLEIPSDFSPGPKKKINELVMKSFQRLTDEDYVASILTAGEARLLIEEYMEDIWQKTKEESRRRKAKVMTRLARQESYLKNSIALLNKNSKKAHKIAYQQLERRLKRIAGQIESLEKTIPHDMDTGTLTEIVGELVNAVDRVSSKENEIDDSLMHLNHEILRTNRLAFTGSFARALNFISQSGKISSLNYSEFVETIGDKDKAEKTIIKLLELGLVSINTQVKK